MDTKQKIAVTAAGFLSAAAVGFSALTGGVGIANAAPPTPQPSTSAGTKAGQGRQQRGPHEHTAATAAEKAKVIAAVKAKDSSVTLTEVVKDPDGSFDARGTKAGQPIMFEVSADHQTVTTGPAGGGRGDGKGRQGTPPGTDATAAEKAKVVAAVKAKDAAVTVNDVRKMDDGSYCAMATKDGARVMVRVSADLKTVTQRTPR